MTPAYWQDALEHLSQDKKMAGLIRRFPKLSLVSRSNAFVTLIRSIVGQQISLAAADNIWAGLEKNIQPLTPNMVLVQTIDDLKSWGLSKQKTHYLHNVAQHFVNNGIQKKYWQNRTFTDIYQELIAIKGVGPWTIEMFGIFYLLEPDIFPMKDLGLIRAINQLYTPTKKAKSRAVKFLSNDEILQLSQSWCPYRTVATWFLWRSIDAEVVQY